MGIYSAFGSVEAFRFEDDLRMFSASLWLSSLTCKFPFMFTLHFLGRVALVGITFTIKKGENLAQQTFSKDSMTMNRGKSAASFSESDSDTFLLGFLLEEAISDVYFSLGLFSITELGMYQGGNQYT